MKNKKPGRPNEQQPNTQSDSASGQLVRQPGASLVERQEVQEVRGHARYQDDPPKSPIGRWLWKYSQIILSGLTFLVLVVYGAQWWQARETRELENRAYVVVKSVGLRQAVDNPGMSDIVVTLTNTGRTPGLNGTTQARLDPRETPIPDDAGFPPLDTTPSKTVLAPQIEVELTLGPVMNRQGEQAKAQEQAAQVAASQKAASSVSATPSLPQLSSPQPKTVKFIYVYGVISYEDVFGRPHQTRYCYFNIPGTPGWNGCPAFNSFS